MVMVRVFGMGRRLVGKRLVAVDMGADDLDDADDIVVRVEDDGGSVGCVAAIVRLKSRQRRGRIRMLKTVINRYGM